MAKSRRGTPGVEIRHATRCASREDGRCSCEPSARAWVYVKAEGRKVRSGWFSGPGAVAAAKGWRVDAASANRRGALRTPTALTVCEVGEEWMEGAERGEILCRFRSPYKPSVLRTYRGDLERYVFPELGAVRLSDVRRRDLQALVDRLLAQGLSGSKARNVLNPIRAIYRRALRDELVTSNPTLGLELPEPAGTRDRVASVPEAITLVDALPEGQRALWAIAFFAGLRRGELRALRDDDVDLERNVIHVRRGWDELEGPIEPKSKKGVRTVPIPGLLRRYLLEHRARTGRRGEALFFGRTASEPFTPTYVRTLALDTWAASEPKPLEPIGLHEARHTYVSLMFDAGIALERIGDYVGHSSAYMVDRYRHLIEGHEQESAERFDVYVAARLAKAAGGPLLGQSGHSPGGS